MGDIYQKKERGVSYLIELLKTKGRDDLLSSAVAQKNRLTDTIAKLRINGDNNQDKAVLNEIMIQVESICWDGFNKTLHDLVKDLEASFTDSNKIKIPLIIVAMTSSQARNLLKNYSANEQLKSLLECVCVGDKIDDLIKRYSRNRKKWEPFGKKHGTISEIVTKFGKKISSVNPFLNDCPEKKYLEIEFQYLSDDFFSLDGVRRNNLKEYLKSQGGIFIVDVVSLFHEEVCNNFLQYQLGELLSIIAISPVSENSKNLCNIVENMIERKLESFYQRYNYNLDNDCALEVYSESFFNHCLSKIIKKYSENDRRANPIKISSFEKKLGRVPKNIGDFVSGRQ